MRLKLVILNDEFKHELDANEQHDADEHDEHAQAQVKTGLLRLRRARWARDARGGQLSSALIRPAWSPTASRRS